MESLLSEGTDGRRFLPDKFFYRRGMGVKIKSNGGQEKKEENSI